MLSQSDGLTLTPQRYSFFGRRDGMRPTLIKYVGSKSIGECISAGSGEGCAARCCRCRCRCRCRIGVCVVFRRDDNNHEEREAHSFDLVGWLAGWV